MRELYDLSTDPHEFTNTADKPEHAKIIADLHARMAQEVGGNPDETELRARRQLADGYQPHRPAPTGGGRRSSTVVGFSELTCAIMLTGSFTLLIFCVEHL